MNYKKIINSRKTRIKILRAFSFVPDRWMVRLQYFIKHHSLLSLKNPVKFTEKIQHYKLYYRDSLIPKCIDKYLVREYVNKKGLSQILIANYGVYNTVKDIPFSELPSKYVVKRTDGGGSNSVYLSKNNNSQSIKDIMGKFSMIEKSKINIAREWGYNQVKSRLIVEELLEDYGNKKNEVDDYKILCFNGTPKYIIVDQGRFYKHTRDIYDIKWNKLPMKIGYNNSNSSVEKPKNYTDMLEIASTLSSDFPLVRVDLYNIEGVIKFGELTFYPYSGYEKIEPIKYDYELGEMFEINYV